jgi:Na+/H+ antiporter NhaC
MILAAMLGISIGMCFARNAAEYSERVFTLMANPVATVAVVCWLWAGAFAGILKESGLVEAIVWMGWQSGVSGAMFTVLVFLLASLFAVSVGSGLATVIGFTPVMYPAGVILGGEPAVLMGAIFSGAALGDNLAPVSDTTIVSATTQEADVAGVVLSRLKYILLAAAISCGLFWVFGGEGIAQETAEAEKVLTEHANPKGLPMLIPAAVVFVIAVSGRHFMVAITTGIVVAVLMGPMVGVFSFADVFHATPKIGTQDAQVGGALVEGAMGLVPIAILTLLLVATIGLMEYSGFLDALMEWLDRTLAKTVKGAEAAIVALISVANLSVSVNTVAMVTVGPLANKLRKRHGIHPYRSANLLDTVSCSFPYLLPYSATIPVAASIHEELHAKYAFVPVLSWAEQVPYMFYGLTLFPIMIIAVATGFGHRRG